MGDTTIEWTEKVWNPVTGCDEVTPGCDHCYAKTLAERFRGTPGHYYERGFDIVLRPDKLDQPLRWKRGRRIFVNSMSDLFHKNVPDTYIAQVFGVMALAPQHTFQLLTKRHGRMRSLMTTRKFIEGPSGWITFEDAVRNVAHNERNRLRAAGVLGPDAPMADTLQWPLPNVWLGVSVEDQQRADLRIPALLETPAAVRFLSCEPLLGPVDLLQHMPEVPYWDSREAEEWGIHWVIAGGESGHGARPMHPDWARSLRDQCRDANVAFLFKQWGDWVPEGMLLHRDSAPAAFIDPDGLYRPLVNGKPEAAPYARGAGMTVRRVGKKAAGRQLDGITHDGYPEVAR